MLRRDLDRWRCPYAAPAAPSPRRSRHAAHARAFPRPRPPQQPLGRGERRFRVAPFAVARRIALALQLGALLQPRLVLGMEGGAAADPGEDARERLLVVDQKVAGGRADEDFDAGGSRQELELGEFIDIVAAWRRRRRQSRNACGWWRRRPWRRAPRRWWSAGLVFGISNTAVTPPRTADRLPVSRSSLCSSPGSRKCTWVSITPGRICRPVASMVSPARACADRADLGDAAVPHANIGESFAGLIDDGSAFEDKIEGLGQIRLLLRGLPRSHKCRKPW